MKRAILAWTAAGVSLTCAHLALAQADAAKAPVKAQAIAALDPSAPLPTDERFVTGTFPNGLSYIVVKHATPPGRAVMWIHIASGSLNEKDNQRGIAHYLEHMAFNGSENFKPGSVLDFFQSMGLRFGQDQNAFTSFDQTTYQLSFPDVKPETLQKGMLFFSDVAGKLLLTPEEINRERQVIFEEKRTRAGGRQRIQDYVLERLAPGSLVGLRLPIGTDETLSKVSRPDFIDYYQHWYVPSNMTVIVVADADPKMIVEQITKAFSGGEKKPKPVDQDPKISPSQGVRGIVASDKELTSAEIQFTRDIEPKQTPTTTVGDLHRDLVREMGLMAFNRRIGAKLDKGGTSYLGVRAEAGPMFRSAFSSGVTINGEPGKWKEMLSEAGTELQRARLHGFTQRELDDVRHELISGAERQVETEATEPAGVMIREMNNELAEGNTIMSARQELELLKKMLPTITPEEIAVTFAKEFDFSSVVFVGQFPAEMPGGVPTESDLIAAGAKALDVKPAAETEASRASALLSSTPKPGAIAEQSEHAPTKVVSGWLDNGVRFHYRFMDYEKDQVSVSIALAAGTIQETPQNRGLAELAGLAWARPATSTLNSTDIRDLMTGKKSNARGGAGMDTLSIGVDGSPAELETGMQLAYLMLTDPVIEKAAFDQWKTRQLRGIEARRKSVDGVFAETLAGTIFPESEARTQPMTAEQVNKLSPEASQKWLREEIAKAPMEVTIVGDITQDRAMELLKTYIGSLPKRERISSTTLNDLRKIARPTGPRSVEKTVDTETDKANVAVGFYACDMENTTDRRNLQVASRIISTRMFKLVRAEEQLAYSPRAGLSPGREYPGFGTFAMVTQTNPTKIARLIELTGKLYADFAKDGPTEEEMSTVKKQMANELDEQMRQPKFWQAMTGQMSYRGSKLDDVVSAPEYYQNVTADQVRATFTKYCTPEAQMSVAVKPAKVTGKTANPDAKSEGDKKDDAKPSKN